MNIRHAATTAVLLALLGAAAATAQTAAPSVTIQRVAVPAVYTPGQIIDVTVTITKNDSRAITSIGLVDTVPGTWQLDSFYATDPAMRPGVGREVINDDGSKSFEFAYITIPSFPAMFTYRARTGSEDSGTGSISGYAKFRFTGAEEQSPVVVTPVMAAGSGNEGEPTDGGDGCAGCGQSAKSIGATLADLFVGALAVLTLLALSRHKG